MMVEKIIFFMDCRLKVQVILDKKGFCLRKDYLRIYSYEYFRFEYNVRSVCDCGVFNSNI